MGFENFGGSSVGYLKITEDKSLKNADLRPKARVTFQPQCGCHTPNKCDVRGMFYAKCDGRDSDASQNSIVSQFQCEPASSVF